MTDLRDEVVAINATTPTGQPRTYWGIVRGEGEPNLDWGETLRISTMQQEGFSDSVYEIPVSWIDTIVLMLPYRQVVNTRRNDASLTAP